MLSIKLIRTNRCIFKITVKLHIGINDMFDPFIDKFFNIGLLPVVVVDFMIDSSEFFQHIPMFSFMSFVALKCCFFHQGFFGCKMFQTDRVTDWISFDMSGMAVVWNTGFVSICIRDQK